MKSLETIVQTLIINGTLTDSPGLFYGKTGIAVFFFNYARQTGNELFYDYAIDLIDKIQDQITVSISAQYDIGLAGIGVGFEYFVQNGFLEADDNDIFEDLDARMYRITMYEPYSDLNIEGGLTGWGRYFIFRLKGNGKKDRKLYKALNHIAMEISQKITNNTVSESERLDVYRFFYDLTTLHEDFDKYRNTLQKCMKWECIRRLEIQKIFPYMNNLQRLLSCQKYFNLDLTKKIEKEWIQWKEFDKDVIIDLGLLKGWTMEGLLYLASVNKNNISWINLL